MQIVDNSFIYERDRGMCLRCGAPGCDVHHIIFKSECCPMQDSQWNRLTLCRADHNWAHGRTVGALREGMSDKRARQRELLRLLADCHRVQDDPGWLQLWLWVGGNDANCL